MTLVHSNSCIF